MEQVADSSFQGMQSNGRAINDSPYCNVHPRDRITRQINDPLKFCLTGPNQDTKKDDAHQQPCSVSNQATSYCSPRQMDSASTKCPPGGVRLVTARAFGWARAPFRAAMFMLAPKGC